MDKVYIVGGWIRDKILGHENRDLDLVVFGDSSAAAKEIVGTLKGSFVVLDESNSIYRVVLKNNKYYDYIDFAKAKGQDILSDLYKRDFTINSIAVPLNDYSKFIDPLGGIKDIKKKIIRANSRAAFKDDPLRMLRAFRFASELGFVIEPKSLRMIKQNCGFIKKVSGERVRDELFKIFSNVKSAQYLVDIDRHKLLENIVPEIIKMKKSARKFYFHPNGLWQHSIETLEGLEEICLTLDKLFGPDQTRIVEHLQKPLSSGITRLTLLKAVALLHDVAKPDCAKRANGKMRFLGHEIKGAEKVEIIFRRLKMGNKEIAAAKNIIEHHMRPISLGKSVFLTERAIYRLFRDLNENVIDLMLLTLADCYSYRRLKTNKTVELKKIKLVAGEIIKKYFKKLEIKNKPKLIDGNQVMKHFSLKPGPIIGDLLDAVDEAHNTGKISTRDQAVQLCKSKLTALKKKYRIPLKQY